MLPNFLIIGAMKCGTTTLWQCLADHPDVCVASTKEPMFFNNDDRWADGLAWYESLFSHHDGERAVGEASTGYSKQLRRERIPRRIRRTLGPARIIYVVRNPVERMYSHYVHNVCAGRITDDFAATVAARPALTRIGCYATILELYGRFFPRDHIHVILHDDLRSDLGRVVARTYDFLEVDAAFVPTRLATEGLVGHVGRLAGSTGDRGPRRFRTRLNTTRDRLQQARAEGVAHVDRLLEQPPVLPPETRHDLVATFCDEIERLEKYLGRDLADWDPEAALKRLGPVA